MGTTTTTYALNKPTVGGDEDAWGTDLNTNADKLDDLLDGTIAVKPNLDAGLWKVGGVAVTSTAAELNILDGVTASTAELNIMDGVTATTAEINKLAGTPAGLTATEIGYLDGVTSAIQTQLDAKQASDADLTALAGVSSNGLLVRTGAGAAAARTITSTGGSVTITNPGGVAGNINLEVDVVEPIVLLGTLTTTSGTTHTLSGLTLTPYKFLLCTLNKVSSGAGATLSLDSKQVADALSGGADFWAGQILLDLNTGTFSASVTSGADPSLGKGWGGDTSYTTATTSISFTISSAGDAGSIRVYGMK